MSNLKSFEYKLGKTGLIVAIAGIAVFLVVSFLFGVQVGKNIDTYPEIIASYPRQLLAYVWRPAKMKMIISSKEAKQSKGEGKKQEDIDLTFYDTLTSKKGLAGQQIISEKKVEAEPAGQPLIEEKKNNEQGVLPEKNAGNAPSAKAANVVNQGNKVNKNKEAAVPAPVAGKFTFSLQAASLKDKTKAVQVSRKISSLGYKARVAEADIAGQGKWYRVVVDGFPGWNEARIAADKIEQKIKTKGIIRRISAEVNKSEKIVNNQ